MTRWFGRHIRGEMLLGHIAGAGSSASIMRHTACGITRDGSRSCQRKSVLYKQLILAVGVSENIMRHL
jgi:hypothetical protein